MSCARKGAKGAGTIHSLIYRTRGEDENGPTFVLNDDSAAGKAALIVIDECSMVDAEIGRDLLSFGTPVLVLGDPAQLPPIAGGGFFTEAEPDVMLTEVHRQAADNPIIRLSMIVREGGELRARRLWRERASSAATTSSRRRCSTPTRCWSAATTRGGATTPASANCSIARAPVPVAGDTLVCLRNDRKRGLLNGSLWQVDKVRKPRKGLLALQLSPEDGSRSGKRTTWSRSIRPSSTAPPNRCRLPSGGARTSSISAMC